jgi:hypothetical protein
MRRRTFKAPEAHLTTFQHLRHRINQLLLKTSVAKETVKYTVGFEVNIVCDTDLEFKRTVSQQPHTKERDSYHL